MISIVTAYYNRKELFIRTLESIKKQNFQLDDLELIAVDDGSKEEERLENLIPEFPFLKVIRLDSKNKWYQNSCIPFNIGFKLAKGDKIIIQNPECYHLGNILSFTDKNLIANNYLSFACYSLDKEITDDYNTNLYEKNYIKNIILNNNYTHKKEGELGWYNHSIFRNEAFHFCTAITAKDLKDLGGFDEIFSLGIAYDDDEFITRIKKKEMNIVFVDEEIVLHQNHYSPQSSSFENRTDKYKLMERNKNILYKYTKLRKGYRVNKMTKKFPNKLKKYYIRFITKLNHLS
ncbi:glycosyltransferase family 2 protein [Chryseobacterium gambrini]|uniref:glycosyltransferase family 2 protein n=1 Tax=Chryseobacterium gambrini TaxID=373672 RepID=UPI0022F3FF4B|nr:glycosyltransferase [Chryseobacterium gambrini]WBX95626.1 glycosyltransferase [Chryseobacterium gambrini]